VRSSALTRNGGCATKAENIYETKEVAFEAAVAAAHDVRASAAGGGLANGALDERAG
jgi:hypothetical protein